MSLSCGEVLKNSTCLQPNTIRNIRGRSVSRRLRRSKVGTVENPTAPRLFQLWDNSLRKGELSRGLPLIRARGDSAFSHFGKGLKSDQAPRKRGPSCRCTARAARALIPYLAFGATLSANLVPLTGA